MLDNLEKKPLIIGTCTSLLFFLTGMIIGTNVITGFIVGGMVVGFIVGNGYKTGLKLGAISGFIGGFIILLLNSALLIIQGGTAVLQTYETIFVIYFVIEIIISSIGGALGSLIKSEYNKSDVWINGFNLCKGEFVMSEKVVFELFLDDVEDICYKYIKSYARKESLLCKSEVLFVQHINDILISDLKSKYESEDKIHEDELLNELKCIYMKYVNDNLDRLSISEELLLKDLMEFIRLNFILKDACRSWLGCRFVPVAHHTT